jgi:hypothetical protein
LFGNQFEKTQITKVENSISSNDERINDTIANETGHLRQQFLGRIGVALPLQ